MRERGMTGLTVADAVGCEVCECENKCDEVRMRVAKGREARERTAEKQ